MLLEFAACSHPSARIQQADKSTSGTGGCRAPLTHSFLRRGFFCAVGTAARAGEAGADPPYPPAQECSALHASHGFPSWMQLHGWFLGDPRGWGHPLLPPGCDTSDVTSDAAGTAKEQGER